MSKIVKRVLLAVVAVLLVMQFFRIDKTNPDFEPKKDFLYVSSAPVETANLIKGSCYDCHSNETKYPWYTNVAPVSWWVKGHINEGREHLNFSNWSVLPADKRIHKLEEAAEEVEEGHMPLNSYLWVHQEARLTDEQREMLAGWFETQMNETERISKSSMESKKNIVTKKEAVEE